MKACVQWLGQIAQGMTWDEHMAAAAEETWAKWKLMWEDAGSTQNDALLFELGGVWWWFLVNEAFPHHR